MTRASGRSRFSEVCSVQFCLVLFYIPLGPNKTIRIDIQSGLKSEATGRAGGQCVEGVVPPLSQLNSFNRRASYEHLGTA